nr:immunoglobulin heavy chain junction region [Macaca mulatta]
CARYHHEYRKMFDFW